MFYLVIIMVACLYIVPKTIIGILCFVLRKFSFYASVGGPKTLNDVMLRIPLKVNFAILIRVDQIQLQLGLPGFGLFKSTDKLMCVHLSGL